MSFCHECGAKVAPDDPFCGNCGAAQSLASAAGATIITDGASSFAVEAVAPRLEDTESPDIESDSNGSKAIVEDYRNSGALSCNQPS